MSTDITIRLETENDYRATENLVREAFWNVYRPGCTEHFVLRTLRNDAAFVRALDFVMESGCAKNAQKKIVAQNVFVRMHIDADDGRNIEVLTMGPICVAPDLQRQGLGKRLLDFSLEKAVELGFGAVLFEGNIAFYSKSGFDYASRFKIRYHDLPDGADSSFFLCRELRAGYLDGITGVYQTPQGYYAAEEHPDGFAAFDAGFPKKENLVLAGQIF